MEPEYAGPTAKARAFPSLVHLASAALCDDIKSKLGPFIFHYISRDSVGFSDVRQVTRLITRKFDRLPHEAMRTVFHRLRAICNLSAFCVGIEVPHFIENADFKDNILLLPPPKAAFMTSLLPATVTLFDFHNYNVTEGIFRALASSRAAVALLELRLKRNEITDDCGQLWWEFKSLKRLKISVNSGFSNISLQALAKLSTLAEVTLSQISHVDGAGGLTINSTGVELQKSAFNILLAEDALPSLTSLVVVQPADVDADLRPLVALLLALLKKRKNRDLLHRIPLPLQISKSVQMWPQIEEIHLLCPNLNVFVSSDAVFDWSLLMLNGISYKEMPNALLRHLNVMHVNTSDLETLELLPKQCTALETLIVGGEAVHRSLSHLSWLDSLDIEIQKPSLQESDLAAIPRSISKLRLVTWGNISEDAPRKPFEEQADKIVSFLCENFAHLRKLHLQGRLPYGLAHAKRILASMPHLEDFIIEPKEPFNELVSSSEGIDLGSTQLSNLPFILGELDAISTGYSQRLEKFTSYHTRGTTLKLIGSLSPRKAPWLRKATLRTGFIYGQPVLGAKVTKKEISVAVKTLCSFKSTLTHLHLLGEVDQQSLHKICHLRNLTTLSLSATTLSIDLCYDILSSLPMLFKFEVDSIVDVRDTLWLTHPCLRIFFCTLRVKEKVENPTLVFDPSKVPHLTQLVLRLQVQQGPPPPTTVHVTSLQELEYLSILSDYDNVAAYVLDCKALKNAHINLHRADEIQLQGCPKLQVLDFFGTLLSKKEFKSGKFSVSIPAATQVQLRPSADLDVEFFNSMRK